MQRTSGPQNSSMQSTHHKLCSFPLINSYLTEDQTCNSSKEKLIWMTFSPFPHPSFSFTYIHTYMYLYWYKYSAQHNMNQPQNPGNEHTHRESMQPGTRNLQDIWQQINQDTCILCNCRADPVVQEQCTVGYGWTWTTHCMLYPCAPHSLLLEFKLTFPSWAARMSLASLLQSTLFPYNNTILCTWLLYSVLQVWGHIFGCLTLLCSLAFL